MVRIQHLKCSKTEKSGQYYNNNNILTIQMIKAGWLLIIPTDHVELGVVIYYLVLFS